MHLAQAFYRERGPGGRSIVWGGYSGRGALVSRSGLYYYAGGGRQQDQTPKVVWVIS